MCSPMHVRTNRWTTQHILPHLNSSTLWALRFTSHISPSPQRTNIIILSCGSWSWMSLGPSMSFLHASWRQRPDPLPPHQIKTLLCRFVPNYCHLSNISSVLIIYTIIFTLSPLHPCILMQQWNQQCNRILNISVCCHFIYALFEESKATDACFRNRQFIVCVL